MARSGGGTARAIRFIGAFRILKTMINTMFGTDTFLDTKGRVRASKEQRRLILAEYERSGLSAVRFARLAGLKYSTFAGWLQRYRRVKPVRLLEAAVAPPEPSALLVLSGS